MLAWPCIITVNGNLEVPPENAFLARLLESATENIDIETDENSEESRVEEALSIRMADTKKILSAILELIRHQCHASDQQLVLLKKSIKESGLLFLLAHLVIWVGHFDLTLLLSGDFHFCRHCKVDPFTRRTYDERIGGKQKVN